MASCLPSEIEFIVSQDRETIKNDRNNDRLKSNTSMNTSGYLTLAGIKFYITPQLAFSFAWYYNSI